MKKIIFVLMLIASFSFTTKEVPNLSTYASNDKFDIQYWQYTTYSDYAGYLFNMNNFTDRAGTVTVELVDIGVVETFYVEPYSYNGFQVGYDYVSAGNPFVNNMKVRVTFTAGWTSKLTIKTSDFQ